MYREEEQGPKTKEELEVRWLTTASSIKLIKNVFWLIKEKLGAVYMKGERS